MKRKRKARRLNKHRKPAEEQALPRAPISFNNPLKQQYVMTEVIAVVYAHNEQRSLRRSLEILNSFRAQGKISRVVVVNDGSIDGTAKIAEEMGAIVVSHTKNLGKRQSFMSGASAAKRLGAEVMLSLDADILKFPEQTLNEMVGAVKNPKGTLMATAQQYERTLIPGYYLRIQKPESRSFRAINMQMLEPLFRGNEKWLQYMNTRLADPWHKTSEKRIKKASKWGLEAALEILAPRGRKIEVSGRIYSRIAYRKGGIFAAGVNQQLGHSIINDVTYLRKQKATSIKNLRTHKKYTRGR